MNTEVMSVIPEKHQKFYQDHDETIMRFYSMLNRCHGETLQQDSVLSKATDLDEIKMKAEDMEHEMAQCGFVDGGSRISTPSKIAFELNTTSSNIELKHLLEMYKREKRIEAITELFVLTVFGRDIYFGKGERYVSYQHVITWHKSYPDIGRYLLDVFVKSISNTPVGSWRDVREVAYLTHKKERKRDHPLIKHCAWMYASQISEDYVKMANITQNKSDVAFHPSAITMAAKWCPRERGKHTWFFRMVAMEFYRIHFNKEPNTKVTAYKTLRSHVTSLCSRLNTLERNMCTKRYDQIKFDQIPMLSQIKHLEWFSTPGKGDKRLLVKRLQSEWMGGAITHLKSSVSLPYYQLISMAVKYRDLPIESVERKYLNLLWETKLGEKDDALHNTLPIIDMSRHMENNENMPLYNAIGMAIHTASISRGALSRYILTYCSDLQFFSVDDFEDITEVVTYIMSLPRGMYSTIHKPVLPLAYMLSDAKCANSTIDQLTLVFFSNLIHDDIATYMDFIFSLNKYATYPPKCVYFNIGTQNEKVTDEHFSLVSLLYHERNVMYMSGYNLAPLVYALKNQKRKELKVIGTKIRGLGEKGKDKDENTNKNKDKGVSSTNEKPNVFTDVSGLTPSRKVRKWIEAKRYKHIYNWCYDYLFDKTT